MLSDRQRSASFRLASLHFGERITNAAEAKHRFPAVRVYTTQRMPVPAVWNALIKQSQRAGDVPVKMDVGRSRRPYPLHFGEIELPGRKTVGSNSSGALGASSSCLPMRPIQAFVGTQTDALWFNRGLRRKNWDLHPTHRDGAVKDLLAVVPTQWLSWLTLPVLQTGAAIAMTLPGRAARCRPLTYVVLLLAMGCATPAPGGSATERFSAAAPAPLPLRISIQGIMIGAIDFSSHGVFAAALSDKLMSDRDWSAAGLAAMNLIGSSTLITLPGTGDTDQAWVRDPRWSIRAAGMQQASVDAGIAVRNRDRVALILAADRIAKACQACHDDFRPELPKVVVTRLASS